MGRQRQIELTAEGVRQAMANAEIESPDDVHFVQVKGPAFPLVEIVAATEAPANPARPIIQASSWALDEPLQLSVWQKL